jgi:hypothetical protein
VNLTIFFFAAADSTCNANPVVLSEESNVDGKGPASFAFVDEWQATTGNINKNVWLGKKEQLASFILDLGCVAKGRKDSLSFT